MGYYSFTLIHNLQSALKFPPRSRWGVSWNYLTERLCKDPRWTADAEMTDKHTVQMDTIQVRPACSCQCTYILIHHYSPAFHLHLKMPANRSPQLVQFTHGWQVQFLPQGLTFIPNKLGGSWGCIAATLWRESNMRAVCRKTTHQTVEWCFFQNSFHNMWFHKSIKMCSRHLSMTPMYSAMKTRSNRASIQSQKIKNTAWIKSALQSVSNLCWKKSHFLCQVNWNVSPKPTKERSIQRAALRPWCPWVSTCGKYSSNPLLIVEVIRITSHWEPSFGEHHNQGYVQYFSLGQNRQPVRRTDRKSDVSISAAQNRVFPDLMRL